jgi:type II secretory pathway component PulF
MDATLFARIIRIHSRGKPQMPLYQYDSFNKRGERIQGSIDASTENEAKEMLKGQGLMPVSIKTTTGTSSSFSLKNIFEKSVDTKTKVIFTKQLGVLLKAGIPLLQSIELLINQFEGPFKRILITVKDGLQEGKSFASQLALYPKVFPNVYIQLTKAGEASGKLEVILKRLTHYLERSEETKKHLKKAMSYPIIMISFALLVVVGVLAFLVPKIKDLFSKMGGKALPTPTQILIDMSDFCINNFTLIAVASIAAIVGFLYWKKSPSGRYKMDEIILRAPIISYFSKTKAIVQFCKTLGMLLESGVNLSEALDIVCNIVDNEVLTKKLREARDNIIKEGKIAKYLKKTGIFPPIATYMISTGEESGKLADMLLTVGSDYDDELMEITDSLTDKISPIMMVVMAVIILFVILAIFLPIISMGEGMGI